MTVVDRPAGRPVRDRMPNSSPYLRNLLLYRTEWMETRVVDSARRNGDTYLTPAMSRMFGYIARGPIGVSDLARHLGVSRQGVHKLASEAARFGLIEFVDSSADRRIKLLEFTAKGRAMSVSAVREFAAIENELVAQLGRQDVDALKRILGRAWPGEPPG
jgi:DNA-binding MarR family transcriptional regulator